MTVHVVGAGVATGISPRDRSGSSAHADSAAASATIETARLLRTRMVTLPVGISLLRHAKCTSREAHGHPAGDRVLREVARTCADALRDGDLLGRIGGEEFLAVLPRTLIDHAVDVAERLRRRVETLEFPGLPGSLRVSISIGVAQALPHDRDIGALIERADAALYRAKAMGRNRVVSAETAE